LRELRQRAHYFGIGRTSKFLRIVDVTEYTHNLEPQWRMARAVSAQKDLLHDRFHARQVSAYELLIHHRYAYTVSAVLLLKGAPLP
jgi:hypothetical protein